MFPGLVSVVRNIGRNNRETEKTSKDPHRFRPLFERARVTAGWGWVTLVTENPNSEKNSKTSHGMKDNDGRECDCVDALRDLMQFTLTTGTSLSMVSVYFAKKQPLRFEPFVPLVLG